MRDKWRIGAMAMFSGAAASWICLKQRSAFLCSSHQAFFYGRFVRIQMGQPYISTDTATDWKNSCFILSYLFNLMNEVQYVCILKFYIILFGRL